MLSRLLTLLLLLSPVPSYANPDALAKQLFEAGRYAEATELFTEPFWRGIAAYRSEQWVRAAESFAMSPHPMARYNLANCYARLGHYALALTAYQQVLERQPGFEDARFNAELMQRLLEQSEDKNATRSQPSAPDDEAETESDETKQGEGEGAEPPSQQSSEPEEDTAPATTAESISGDQSMTSASTPREGKADSQINDGQAARNDQTERIRSSASASSGQFQDDEADSDAQHMSAEEQREQRTEQWLSTIEDNPARFLKARIELEMRRRAEAGTLATPGASPW